MPPNPIRKVLSTIRKHGVAAFLMGGQACVFYGAAEFSRDVDLAILSHQGNFHSLQEAMSELEAEVIAIPAFEPGYLERGHAVHFRCRHADAAGLWVDVMTRMRGVDEFPALWARRTTIETPEGDCFDLMGLPDLGRAKKTQRDKDWPMIRRLVEAHLAQFGADPTPERRRFWLDELRTPALLLAVRAMGEIEVGDLSPSRRWLAERGDWTEEQVDDELRHEEQREREADRVYWMPLKKELEALRRARPQKA